MSLHIFAHINWKIVGMSYTLKLKMNSDELKPEPH